MGRGVEEAGHSGECMTIQISRRSLIGAASAGTMALAAAPAMSRTPAKPPLFGPAPGTAWLTYNENPYGPSPRAIQAMAETASKGCYYADDANDRLRAMVGQRFGLTPEHAVIGNGSQEVLSAAALEWSRHGPIVIPELMFDEPLQVAKRHGAEFIPVPLRPDMAIDLDGMAAAATASKASLVYLCNPNNPTAMLVDPRALRALSARLPAGTA